MGGIVKSLIERAVCATIKSTEVPNRDYLELDRMQLDFPSYVFVFSVPTNSMESVASMASLQ